MCGTHGNSILPIFNASFLAKPQKVICLQSTMATLAENCLQHSSAVCLSVGKYNNYIATENSCTPNNNYIINLYTLIIILYYVNKEIKYLYAIISGILCDLLNFFNRRDINRRYFGSPRSSDAISGTRGLNSVRLF